MNADNPRIVPVYMEEVKNSLALQAAVKKALQKKHKESETLRPISSTTLHRITDEGERAEVKKELVTIDRDTVMRTIDVSSDEITNQDVSMYRKKLDVTTEKIVCTNMDEAPKLMTQVIILDGLEKVGGEWHSVVCVNKMCGFNYRLWLYMSNRTPKLLYQYWTLLCLAAYCGFYCYFLALNSSDVKSVNFVIGVILLVLDPLYMICVGFETYYVCRVASGSEVFLTFYAWVQCMYCGISVFISITLIFESDSLGWAFASAVYATGIVQAVNVSLWLVFLPVLMLCCLAEFLARAFSCKLQCPYMRPKRRVYKYAVYRFGQGQAREAKQCAICLADYTKVDADLCVLQCMTGHVYHERCIFEWIKKQEYCPVCRGEIKFATS